MYLTETTNVHNNAQTQTSKHLTGYGRPTKEEQWRIKTIKKYAVFPDFHHDNATKHLGGIIGLVNSFSWIRCAITALSFVC